jgi:lipopolysaccharide/colanic/teichoic acid biosynthesis glycosyltransferase
MTDRTGARPGPGAHANGRLGTTDRTAGRQRPGAQVPEQRGMTDRVAVRRRPGWEEKDRSRRTDSAAERQGPGRPADDRPGGNGFVKRVLDLSIAVVALLLLAPLLAVLWLAVRLGSPGPGIFRQERLGRDQRPFTMYKFRSMTAGNSDAIHRAYVSRMLTEAQPAAGEGLFKLEHDPRVTRLGGWLRRTSLDELPQLFNVVRGDMSLVGPRPVLAWEAELFSDEARIRFRARPGLTGLWQVSGRSRLSMPQALALDVEYVRRQSLWLDLTILGRTLPAMLRGAA